MKKYISYEEGTDDKKELELLSGTFEIGCGITAKDENWNIYVLLVVAERNTNKPCVNLQNKVYFKEEVQK